MIITLERTPAPEDMGPTGCAICTQEFEQGVVLAWATTSEADRGEMGGVCPECVEHMGYHPSGRFPTVAEYRRLEAEWLTPVYASGEEADRAMGYVA
jgi:hypothetical protein